MKVTKMLTVATGTSEDGGKARNVTSELYNAQTVLNKITVPQAVESRKLRTPVHRFRLSEKIRISPPVSPSTTSSASGAVSSHISVACDIWNSALGLAKQLYSLSLIYKTLRS